MRLSRWSQGLVMGFWFLQCAGVVAFWALVLSRGAGWSEGLLVYQNGNIPLFHLVAELAMAVVVAVGLVGWRGRRTWGPPLALVGAGMFGYSAINSMGWAIHNDPVLAVPMVVSLLGVPLLLLLTLNGPRREPAERV